MTTIFTYKYYDVNTEKFEGEFPLIYWESEKIPLFGCPGVSAWLILFPNGSSSERSGSVSAYIDFECENKAISMEVKIEVTIDGVEKVIKGDKITVGKDGETDFGESWGWHEICGMENIFKDPSTILQFAVTVLKFTEKKEKRTIVTKPSGVQEHIVHNRCTN